MNKEQMEDAVAEMRLLIDLFERGVLEQEYPGQAENNLRLVLRDRELWLEGGIFLSRWEFRGKSAETSAYTPKTNLRGSRTTRGCTLSPRQSNIFAPPAILAV